ncbi:hypothetical protein DRN86_00350 [Candidatus Geothermarchaeota archaeon]|nr:MAG: hypothetical protein DRN86_00350 [Candidatus Geothermarchaeota archaeon]
MWVEKYRPKTLAEVVGNEQAKSEFVKWLSDWKKRKVKELGVFFIGPQGVGKTSLAYAAANDFGYQFIELNASDVRTESAILRKLAPISGTISLDSFSSSEFIRKDIMVFLDEVDGIYGHSDRGGLGAIMELARQRNILLILSANFPDAVKHKELLKNFKRIYLHPLSPRQILIILKRICETEHLNISADILQKISMKSRGDARFAINTLHMVAMGHPLPEDLEVNLTTPLAKTVNDLIQCKDHMEAINKISYSLSRIDEIYRALSEAIANSNLDTSKRAEIFDLISKIDVFMRKIAKKGQWKILREVIYLLASTSLLIPGDRVRYVEKIPDYVFSKVIYKSRSEKFNEIINSLKRRLHCSRRKIVQYMLPYLAFLAKNNRRISGLSKDDINVMLSVLT